MTGRAGRRGRRRAIAPAIAIALAIAGGCRDRRPIRRGPPDAPAPRPLEAAALAPPAAPAPTRTIGRGPPVAYPRPIPLVLAPGVEPPAPPLRVRGVWPVPGGDLALVYGLIGDAPAVMRVALGPGRVDWVAGGVCGGPVVHVTATRAVCAGARGIDALEVGTGRAAWRSPLGFRAAAGERLLAADDAGAGAILAAEDGATVARVAAPAGEPLAEVRRMCAGDDGLALYAWSAVGRLRRLQVGADGATRLVWSRALGGAPSKVDLCDPTLVVEVPIPGSSLRTLRALSAATGADVGGPIEALGWWPARGAPGIETSGPDGLTLRRRDLVAVRPIAADLLGSRSVAEAGDDRLLRAVGGTLVHLAGDGGATWLAAPARVDDAVLSADRLLAGAWLVPPATRAEHPALFALPPRPAPGARSEPPLLPPSPAPLADQAIVYPVGEPVRWREGDAVVRADAGAQGVSHVALAGGELFLVTLEQRPGPGYGAGLAAFDLATRAFTWHRDRACPANATVVGVAAADDVVVCAAVEPEPGPGAVVAVARATGEPRWRVALPTVDAVVAGGEVVVAVHGSRASVLRAADGQLLYQLDSDNRHRPRLAVMAGAGAAPTRVVAVEAGGVIAARDPGRGGAPLWSIATRGYVADLEPAGARVAVSFASGELYLLDPEDGAEVAVGGWSAGWVVPGGADLALARVATPDGQWGLRAFGPAGAAAFEAGYAIPGPLELAALRGAGAPLVAATYRGIPRALLIEPAAGALVSVHELPPRHVRGGLFAAHVAGRPVAGAVVERPAGVALF